MGNIAISVMNSSLAAVDELNTRQRKREERKRIKSMIPRYIEMLRKYDLSITSIDLNAFGVDGSMVRLLSASLIGCTSVKELHLDHNIIDLEGATCVARVLSENQKMQYVSLAHSDIGSAGASAIASALESNHSVVRLDLSYCGIDDDGIQKLAKSLTRNSTLRYLNLVGNFISSVGVHALLKAVYDTSDGLRSLWGSNHSIISFFGQGSTFSTTFPQTPANKFLVQQLRNVITSYHRPNLSPRAAARRKIVRYLNGSGFNVSEFASMDSKVMHKTLSWLGKYGDLSLFYKVMRGVPELVDGAEK